jgi:predicted nucleic acid-binding Zn ribbon protein
MSSAKPLNQLIHQFLESVGIGAKIEENSAIVYWDSVVGQEISQRTEPYKIAEGILYVRVKDPVWRNELQFFKNEIIDKLNSRIGKQLVKEVKFF